METVLCPGRFISERASYSFVQELEDTAGRIAEVIEPSPERAVGYYEIFIAACYEKAEEVDDSSGYFGAFGGSLFARWVIACQAASADPAYTVARLLAWMAHDQYGFWSNVEEDIASALDEAGRAACVARIEHLLGSGAESLPNPAYARRQLDKLLRAVYVARRDARAYIALAEQSGLTAKDCHAVATIFAAKDEKKEALSWVERGLEIDDAEPHGSFAGYDLRELRRTFLVELGRHEEAGQAAWADFVRTPSVYGYNALMELVPAPERATWHEKAIDSAVQRDRRSLPMLIPLLVETKETARLAGLTDGCTDGQLGQASYYMLQAAEALQEGHPRQAARLWCAMGLSIVDAGKSRHYGAALDHFERAKQCYAAAGLPEDWEQVVERVRANHSRKTGFIRGFEEVVAGSAPEPGPTFLEKAKARWMPPSPEPGS